MSFAFNFDRENDVYQFAYCYPYSYTRLQNYLDNIEKKNYDFFQRELLCLSVVCTSVTSPCHPVQLNKNNVDLGIRRVLWRVICCSNNVVSTCSPSPTQTTSSTKRNRRWSFSRREFILARRRRRTSCRVSSNLLARHQLKAHHSHLEYSLVQEPSTS